MADYEDKTEDSDPSGSKDFKLWMSRVKRAQNVRKDWEKKYKVEKCEKFYLGDQWEGDKGPRVMNRYMANVRATQPNLLFQNPKVLVRPKPGHEANSRYKASVGESTLQAVMNQDDNFENATAFGLLQAFWRIGSIKVIYDPKLEPNPNYQGQPTPMAAKDEDGNAILDEMQQPTPMLDPATQQPIMEPELVTTDDAYRFEWVPGEDMLFPDDGPDMSKWPWIGQEITTTLAEAKEDPRFPPDLREQLECNVKKDKDKKKKSSAKETDENETEDDKLIMYSECYDIRKKRWYVVADGQKFKECLLADVLPDGIEDHPFAILPGFIPITGPEPSPWPCPYTYSWLDPQEEWNIRRNQGMEGAKRSARKIGYDDSTFENPDEATKALQSSRDMEAVKLKDIKRPWVIIQDPGLAPAINQDLPWLQDDYRTIAGQSGSKMGSPDADTATEAQIVDRASQLRDGELQKAVQKWLKVALRKMFQLIRKTMTVGMFVKIRGMEDKEVQTFLQSKYGIPPEALQLFPDLVNYVAQMYGQERVEPISRETLAFEADIEVLPGSTKPRSLTSERAQFLEVLQILAQSPQLMLSRLLMEELFKKYEFVNPALIDELQALAQTLMQANNTQAGRGGTGDQNPGGQNTAPENTKGQGPRSQVQSQAKQAA